MACKNDKGFINFLEESNNFTCYDPMKEGGRKLLYTLPKFVVYFVKSDISLIHQFNVGYLNPQINLF